MNRDQIIHAVEAAAENGDEFVFREPDLQTVQAIARLVNEDELRVMYIGCELMPREEEPGMYVRQPERLNELRAYAIRLAGNTSRAETKELTQMVLEVLGPLETPKQ